MAEKVFTASDLTAALPDKGKLTEQINADFLNMSPSAFTSTIDAMAGNDKDHKLTIEHDDQGQVKSISFADVQLPVVGNVWNSKIFDRDDLTKPVETGADAFSKILAVGRVVPGALAQPKE